MVYRAGEYIRLSEQDGDKKESESVENQRDLINHFIEKNNDLVLVDEYVDDGFTGGNFDRPAFKRMIKDIEEGRINCIITKDLSRFGRDHIDTGYYLERYLPKKNIRYIAIGDNVDTIDPRGLQFLSFKLSFNDYYIQDISNKIKSVKKKKMINGEYQAGIAPYGYKKDEDVKNHLVIDEEVYRIVQEIFDMYANKNMSTIQIADELNRRKITPPSVYLEMPCTKRKCKNPDGQFCWLRTQIGKMLNNEVYIGSVVSGKKEQISPKVKKGRQKNKDEYIISKNMHEPIIDMDLWNKVQEKLSSYNIDNSKKYNYILKGLVYCGECGNEATFQHCKSKNKKGEIYWEGNYAICKKRNNYVSLCSNKVIGEHILINAVKDVLKKEIENIDYSSKELKKIYEKAKTKADTNVKSFNSKLEETNKQLKVIENNISDIYKKKLAKIITLEEFNKKYNDLKNERIKLSKQIEEIEKQIDGAKVDNADEKKEYNKMKKVAKDFLKMQNPDAETIKRLVKKIVFDKNKNINIELTFSNPYDLK